MLDTNQNISSKIERDLLSNINLSKGFKIWMGILTISLLACLSAYYTQLRVGLGVTGLGDYVSWGMYISNFVFFVATSLIGMLISAVLGLSGQKWITPITRIAEFIALAFAMVAGLVIVSDMGRPERLINVFIHGRFQSPILWDVTVVSTYVAISALLLYLPMIPDLAICHQKLEKIPKLLRKAYKILSLNWVGTKEQKALILRLVRILLILVIPVAFAIHTVTSWLFAVTPRVGWNSTIFGPYFISGAFVSGTAAVIIAMFFYRTNFKLQDYITEKHFNLMGKLLFLVSLIYFYFNLNEFLVPGYKLMKHDAIHLEALFSGRYAPLFWSVQILGLIIPMILLLLPKFRKPLPMLMIGMAVLLGSWFKRFLIVVPTMEHPYLPIQHVPDRFKLYSPTLMEIAITMASFILVLIIITVLSKLFPVVPVYETIHEKQAELVGEKPE